MKVRLQQQAIAQLENAGLRMLRQILWNMVKGKIGLFMQVWHTRKEEALRLEASVRLKNELEAKSADEATGAALRRLIQLFKGLMRGVSAMRIEIWRQKLKVEGMTRQ